MNAIITTTNQSIKGKTIQDIRKAMQGMLKVEGPRGLTALTETGATIHVELYEGQDYIKLANGRILK